MLFVTTYPSYLDCLCTIASKINVTSKGSFFPSSKTYSILSVANLLAHNSTIQIYYCSQISLQSAAFNCSFSGNLTPLGVTFILLAMLQWITIPSWGLIWQAHEYVYFLSRPAMTCVNPPIFGRKIIWLIGCVIFRSWTSWTWRLITSPTGWALTRPTCVVTGVCKTTPKLPLNWDSASR